MLSKLKAATEYLPCPVQETFYKESKLQEHDWMVDKVSPMMVGRVEQWLLNTLSHADEHEGVEAQGSESHCGICAQHRLSKQSSS